MNFKDRWKLRFRSLREKLHSRSVYRILSMSLAASLSLSATACHQVPAPEPEDERIILQEALNMPHARLGLPESERSSVHELGAAELPPLDVNFAETVIEEEELPEDPILQQLLSHILRIPILQAEHYHPLVPRNAYDYMLNDFLFVSLFRDNLRGEPEEELVKTVRYNDSGTIMEITLHNDFYFSDGSLVEAEDVLEGLEILSNEPAAPLIRAIYDESPWTKDLQNILDIEKIDAFGLRIYLDEPDPFLHYALNFPVLKRGQWEKSGILSYTTSGPYGFNGTEAGAQRLSYRDAFKTTRSRPFLETVLVFDYADPKAVQQAFVEQVIDLCVAWPGENMLLDDYRFYPLTMQKAMALRFNKPEEGASSSQIEQMRWSLFDIYYNEQLFKPVAAAVEPAPYPYLPQHMAWQQLERETQRRSRPAIYEGTAELKESWTLLASRGDLFSEEVARAVSSLFNSKGYDLSVKWLAPEDFELAKLDGDYDLVLESFDVSLTPDPYFFTTSERRGSTTRPVEPFYFFDDDSAAESKQFFDSYGSPQQGVRAVLASPDYAYYFQNYLSSMNFLSILHYRQAIYLNDRLEGSLYPLPLHPLNGWEGLWKWSERLSQQELSSSTK